jgi:hypothetical protein
MRAQFSASKIVLLHLFVNWGAEHSPCLAQTEQFREGERLLSVLLNQDAQFVARMARESVTKSVMAALPDFRPIQGRTPVSPAISQSSLAISVGSAPLHRKRESQHCANGCDAASVEIKTGRLSNPASLQPCTLNAL